MSGLDEAIERYRSALSLHPPGHSQRPMYLNNLAISLRNRYLQRRVMSDLEEAIMHHREATSLIPPDDSHRFTCLNNLAISLGERFRQRGKMLDLDEAIYFRRVALPLPPPSDLHLCMSLNNLANSLRDRFQLQGIISDLDEAIIHHRTALLLTDDSNRPMCLNNLAISLRDRSRQQGIMSEHDDAIKLHREALSLCPIGHSHQSTSMNNLANSLRERYQQEGMVSDLNDAIELHRKALHLRLVDDPERLSSLNDLALSLRDRFLQQGQMSDLEEAIDRQNAALLLIPPGHSHRLSSLNNLALSLQDRFRRQNDRSDLERAFMLYSQLSDPPHAVSRTHLSTAKTWAASADIFNHSSALRAYKVALKFLDQQVALLSSSSHHFDVIREVVSSLSTDAFSCSVRRGALITAVELMEQGRAVLWTQLARFNIPLDELFISGDARTANLAEDFKRLSIRLRNAFDQSEDQSPQIRQLTMQWDEVVSRIRLLPNFSRFLLPPLFSDLQKAAEDGPVIIVNASQHSCDALIIHSARDPVHVPLDITQAKVFELSSQLDPSDELELVGILRKLWNDVVNPIVQALRESEVRPGSRIWWCPTAGFTPLPLHAAGPYEERKDNLSDIYISSYTPTLGTLVRARQQVSGDVSSQHFVAIGQGNPYQGEKLECVARELVAVADHVDAAISFTSLEDDNATVEGALDAFSRNQWLHLACHGTPNRTQPFESSFAMRDGPLMIKDIIQSNCKNPQFAFLSACHTTVGDKTSPDESIHLAAAMQFCGFRSVIGSMWSVNDEVASKVVSTFYRKLIGDSERLACTGAAVALHEAVRSLREEIPLEQQIVFIHIGV
ncbi:CHAT domain-containing protein [Suillus fuscotomentosus]|uniref:CHAT domain-containing protein n=1 Tax=Suillus fuscotomentosus TaxID=1912939 RepID=A0AAD4HTS3_9AGAM|nr:CHAT domain-containing protein [Suillus fuscotomentosus]KAG1908578.1 CHAT domain-containing protein [Suillus fuscotomentosus]